MYSELTLHFDLKPTPHQSFRRGRNGIAYTPKKILDFKKDVAWELLYLEKIKKLRKI